MMLKYIQIYDCASCCAISETNVFYSIEVKYASGLYENLGFGIGLFQTGTNLFWYDILYRTLYIGDHLISIEQLTFDILTAL